MKARKKNLDEFGLLEARYYDTYRVAHMRLPEMTSVDVSLLNCPAHPLRSVQMKNASLQCDGGCLGAVAGLQFGENLADMKFDGDFRDPKRAANFLVASAFGDE